MYHSLIHTLTCPLISFSPCPALVQLYLVKKILMRDAKWGRKKISRGLLLQYTDFFFFLTKCKWPHHANTDLIKTKSSWSASFT